MATKTFTLGDVWVETVTFLVNGTPTDPTAFTAVVTKPDGTAASPTITSGGTGIKVVSTPTVKTDPPGLWHLDATGTGTAAGSKQAMVAFRRSEAPGANLEQQALVGVHEMQLFLDRQNVALDLDEVEWLEYLINEASSAIADYCGGRQFTPERTASGRQPLQSDPLATGVTKKFEYEGNSYLSFAPWEPRNVTAIVVGTDLPTASQWTLFNGDTTREAEYRLEPRGKTTLGTWLRAVLPTQRSMWLGPTLPPPYPQGYFYGEVSVTGDWGAPVGAVPSAVERACKITVGDWFRNPEEYANRVEGGVPMQEPVATPGALPVGARMLLGPYRRS